MGGIYWLGTIRILIGLKADSIFMYFPFCNILILGGRVGLGFLFWLTAIASAVGVLFLFPENPIGPLFIVFVAFKLFFWVRVASYCGKPSYLAYLQLVPPANVWAIWKMGSTDGSRQSHGIVLQSGYEEQLAEWIKERIAQGAARDQIEEELKEHKLSKEVFLQLYRKASR